MIREARSISQIGRYRRAGCRERNHLLPSLITDEHEIFILTDRSASHAPKLILVMAALPQAVKVVLETVRVEHAVTEVIVDVSVPVVRTRFDDGVDHAARFVTVLRVKNRRDRFKLGDGVHRRR